jgi:arylsulfatase A-like enzyme
MSHRSLARGILLGAAMLATATLVLALARPSRAASERGQRFPNVLIVTIDTLRPDRLSSYGYRRPTSPNLDRLLASGVRFTQARTVEPLTNPAACSLFTSLYPHEHGATRNGLRLRPGLPSLARTLTRRGFRSAAFVGNWTLKDRISGLGEHFQQYEEAFTRKRWWGVLKGEATAEDLTEDALLWLAEHRKSHRRPFLLWVHYADPHAPYRLQEEFAGRLGVSTRDGAPRSDRYDTEIAFTDHHVGRLLAAIEGDPRLRADTLVVLASDHGESLGEHSYWGHGRNLFEPGLRIPLGFAWAGKVRPQVIDAPAMILDVAPTVLGLAGLPIPREFRGFDWAPVLRGEAAAPRDRIGWYQAHKGAVLSVQEGPEARRKGLLEVGLVIGGRKETFRTVERVHRAWNLAGDPQELENLAGRATELSGPLQEWLRKVQQGLAEADRLPPPMVDAEAAEKLRALGYVD